MNLVAIGVADIKMLGAFDIPQRHTPNTLDREHSGVVLGIRYEIELDFRTIR